MPSSSSKNSKGKNNETFKPLRNFAFGLGIVLVCLLSLITFTPFSNIWFHKISGLSPELAIFALLPAQIATLIPGLTVLISLQRALLINSKKTTPITIATSIVSALLQLPVRRDVAMTGEITLRGRVLPIGGLKEKLFAAHRLGIKRVLIPLENEKDLKEIPPKVLKVMDIVPVEHMDQVLREAVAIDDPDSIFHDEKDDFLSRIMAVKKERPAPTGPDEVTAH